MQLKCFLNTTNNFFSLSQILGEKEKEESYNWTFRVPKFYKLCFLNHNIRYREHAVYKFVTNILSDLWEAVFFNCCIVTWQKFQLENLFTAPCVLHSFSFIWEATPVDVGRYGASVSRPRRTFCKQLIREKKINAKKETNAK